MTRGRGRGRGSTGRGGKSAVRSNNDVTTNVPTFPTPAIVTSPDDVIVQTSGDGSNHTTPESSPTALNQINRTREDMTQGRGTGRESIGRTGKSAARTNMSVRTANMPTIPTPTVAPQTAGGVGAPTSNHGSTSPTTPNQTNPTTVGTYSQTNQVGEDISRSNTNRESNSRRSHVRTLVTITSVGLQSSKVCSNRIYESFKNELDHNGVNWKGVSCDIKDGYFGKFNAVEMGRDPTPSELHLHVYIHGYDGKSFIDECSRIIHERFEEIL
ncbi:hypothetical protein P3L10_033023 [Capsicum annuum]